MMNLNISEIINKYLELFPNEKSDLIKLDNLVNHNKDDINNLFDRKNMEGHITSGGFIYSKKEKKILLLEHKLLKKFLEPGGHVELYDDSIFDAAKREILEETGLKDLESINVAINTDVPFNINTHMVLKNEKKHEIEHYHFDFEYLFIVDSIKEVTINNDESNEYKWTDINEVKNDECFKGTMDKILNLTNAKYQVNQF